MEIINGILLLLALALVWGAVNLERPAVSKVEINQSDQMNESMNFLKRLKRPSAKEDSQSKRLNAWKSAMAKIIPEIPETMAKIEDSHERICQQNDRKFSQLDKLLDSISHSVDETNMKVQQDTEKSFVELSNLSVKIGELNNAIIPLESKLLENQSSLNRITIDAQEVKESVGF
jgi:septal ring factor EnvC (AmiA/AmiB activator)